MSVAEELAKKHGIYPRGVAVLVKPYDPVRTKSAIFVPKSASDKLDMADQMVIFIQAGPLAWNEEKDDEGNVIPRAVPGEVCLVTRHAGLMLKSPRNGEMYRMMNDRDVFCAIDDPAQFLDAAEREAA